MPLTLNIDCNHAFCDPISPSMLFVSPAASPFPNHRVQKEQAVGYFRFNVLVSCPTSAVFDLIDCDSAIMSELFLLFKLKPAINLPPESASQKTRLISLPLCCADKFQHVYYLYLMYLNFVTTFIY